MLVVGCPSVICMHDWLEMDCRFPQAGPCLVLRRELEIVLCRATVASGVNDSKLDAGKISSLSMSGFMFLIISCRKLLEKFVFESASERLTHGMNSAIFVNGDKTRFQKLNLSTE